MKKILGFNEDFVRKQCEEDYVAHDQNGPKFQDDDIFDVALKGADVLSGDNNAVTMLKEHFEMGAC